MIASGESRHFSKSVSLSFAALLILTGCAELPFGIPTDKPEAHTTKSVGTETATPRPSPRVGLGITVDALSAYAAGRELAWMARPLGARSVEYSAARPIGGGGQPGVTVSVAETAGQVDTVTGRIGRRWVDARQYDRFYGELTAFFDHALARRTRDFELDRWVRNIHLSNRLERRGDWSFATRAEDGVVISYVVTDWDLSFVATADADCAAEIGKGPEVWRFGPPDGICGGVFPR